MQHETVIVLDFGGQYNQLIARRVRENNVYCEIYSYKTDLSVIKAKNPKGMLFTTLPQMTWDHNVATQLSLTPSAGYAPPPFRSTKRSRGAQPSCVPPFFLSFHVISVPCCKI